MRKARIMVVDDESVTRLDIREMLEEAGYEVVAEAANGEAAVAKACSYGPDLILMDVKLPKMSGLKASRIINQKQRTPIIALTAYSDAEFVEQAKAAGVIGYLVKPVTESDLVPGIEISLHQAWRQNELATQVAKLEKDLELRKWVDKAKGTLMLQLGISEQAAYRMLQKYSMDAHVSMEVIARQVVTKRNMPPQK